MVEYQFVVLGLGMSLLETQSEEDVLVGLSRVHVVVDLDLDPHESHPSDAEEGGQAGLAVDAEVGIDLVVEETVVEGGIVPRLGGG